jgi:hypothetical protein
MLALKSNFTKPQIFYAEIDDHGIRWGNAIWGEYWPDRGFQWHLA